MKVIIIGGVAGGASTAARLRRLDENAQITIYERSGYISFANCGLPYYIGEVISHKESLTLQTPESFYNRFHIDTKVSHEVIDIDTNAKEVKVKNLVTGEEFFDTYDKLVLSPGAKPIKPKLKGADPDKVFTLRTVEDTLKLYEHIKMTNTKSALIIGGGFIGVETAENLRRLNIDVTLVEAAPQVLTMIDHDMISQVHASLRSNGIKLILNTTSDELGEDDANADIIILAIGVTPDTFLAEKAGLKTGIKGSIVVNDKMETSVSDIYAVGDAIEVRHFVSGNKTLIPLAGPANKQGRIAADNIAGGDSHYKGSQGSSILKLFDLTIASTGLNERQIKELGIDYEKVILAPASHASYYPNGKIMTLKVIFEKTTSRLLGAQIIGPDGVDKRIDVLATAIRAGLLGTDLAELELSYAPPFSSAKDPVNMAGFVIENIMLNKVKQFYYEDLEDLATKNNVFLLDTRTPFEYSSGHVKDFINISVDNLRDRISEVPKDKTIYVMCQSGIRSYIACRILTANGYDCYNFAGGYRFYSMNKTEELTTS